MNSSPGEEKTDVLPGVSSKATTRRRLLTGAAAVPVVMTLPTNASAAAFGSTLRCLDQVDQPKDFFTTSSQTGWASEPINCIHVALPNGSDPHTLGDYGGSNYVERMTGDLWYVVYKDGEQRFFPGWQTTGSGYKVVSEYGGLTYIYVDQYGQYLGTDPSLRNSGGLAVYGSCYISIMGIG